MSSPYLTIQETILITIDTQEDDSNKVNILSEISNFNYIIEFIFLYCQNIHDLTLV